MKLLNILEFETSTTSPDGLQGNIDMQAKIIDKKTRVKPAVEPKKDVPFQAFPMKSKKIKR